MAGAGLSTGGFEPGAETVGAIQLGAEAPVRSLRSNFHGRVAYGEGLALQAAAIARLRAAAAPGEAADELILLEHPPVFTLGKNASEADITGDRARIERAGATIERCDRGGKVTFHGPGQLVGYPILDLRPDRQDVGRYVADLESALIRTVADFGLVAGRFPGYTGIWIDVENPARLPTALAGDGRVRSREGAAAVLPPPTVRKLAAIGVHLSRWITSHGFALNVATDLTWFDFIVPCGIREFGVTSMQQALGRAPALADVARGFEVHFATVFGRELQRGPAADARRSAELAGRR